MERIKIKQIEVLESNIKTKIREKLRSKNSPRGTKSTKPGKQKMQAGSRADSASGKDVTRNRFTCLPPPEKKQQQKKTESRKIDTRIAKTPDVRP